MKKIIKKKVVAFKDRKDPWKEGYVCGQRKLAQFILDHKMVDAYDYFDLLHDINTIADGYKSV